MIDKSKVKNTEVVEVQNGMGKKDTLRYICDSCDKYIKSQDVLNKIIEQSTKDAKSSLKNPLSFTPRTLNITVEHIDSFYYFSTNKLIDSFLIVKTEYKCVGKNAYGTESEINSTNIIFLIGGQIRNDFLNIVRHKPLGKSIDGKIVDRELILDDIEGDGNFKILPMLTKPYSFIIKSSIYCIENGAILTIMFDDKSEIKLKNWNEFNCNGTAYFNLSSDDILNLKNKKVSHISFYSDKLQFAILSENESDYFMQYVLLIKN